MDILGYSEILRTISGIFQDILDTTAYLPVCQKYTKDSRFDPFLRMMTTLVMISHDGFVIWSSMAKGSSHGTVMVLLTVTLVVYTSHTTGGVGTEQFTSTVGVVKLSTLTSGIISI